jgi:hypothetical protein
MTLRVLIIGPGDPSGHLARLSRWNSEIDVVPGREMKGVDLVLLMGGGNGAEAERARSAGVRVAEVADVGRIQDDHGCG